MTGAMEANVLGLIGNLFGAMTTFSASIAYSGLTLEGFSVKAVSKSDDVKCTRLIEFHRWIHIGYIFNKKTVEQNVSNLGSISIFH